MRFLFHSGPWVWINERIDFIWACTDRLWKACCVCLNAPSQSFLRLSDAGMMYNQSAFPPPPAARAFITVYGCLLQHISAVTVIHFSVLACTSPGLLLRSCPSTFSSVSPFAFLWFLARKSSIITPKFPFSPSLNECVNKWVNNFAPGIFLMFHNTSSAFMSWRLVYYFFLGALCSKNIHIFCHFFTLKHSTSTWAVFWITPAQMLNYIWSHFL